MNDSRKRFRGPYNIVFGGSFNPPHLAHTQMIVSAISVINVNEVIIVPCDDHVYKDDLVDFEHRIKMCEINFSHLKNVSVSDIEKSLPSPNYTVQTLKALNETEDYPLGFLAGSDLLKEIPDWTCAEELTEEAELFVMPRQGYPMIPLDDDKFSGYTEIELGFQLPELSSTVIREIICDGYNCLRGFLDNSVKSYIEEQSLYV